MDLIVESKVFVKVMRVREAPRGVFVMHLRCGVYSRLPFWEGPWTLAKRGLDHSIFALRWRVKKRFASESLLGNARGRIVLHSDEVSGKTLCDPRKMIFSHEFPDQKERLKHWEPQ